LHQPDTPSLEALPMPDQPHREDLSPAAMRAQLLAWVAALDPGAVVVLHAFLAWWVQRERPGPEG
jgi:hypothetical protein